MQEGRIDHIRSLDALRGLAALSVLFLHVISSIRGTKFSALWPVDKYLYVADRTPISILWAGSQAVYLFFILSGFALTGMLASSGVQYLPYLVRRICRLWIPYIFAIILAILLGKIFPVSKNELLGDWFNHLVGRTIGIRDIINHVLLVGYFDTTKIDFVTWSLVHEMRISIIFPVILWIFDRSNKRTFLALSFFISLAVIVARRQGFVDPSNTSWISTLIYQLFFVIGIYIYSYKKYVVDFFSSLSKFRKIGISVLSVIVYSNMIGSLYWSSLIGATIICCIAIDENVIRRSLENRFFLWLGAISYSLYLVHPIILIHLVAPADSVLWLVFCCALCLPLSIVCGALFWLLVEKPSNDLGRRLARLFHREGRGG